MHSAPLTSDGVLSTDSPTVGLVALFGSGETSASGRKVFEWVLRRVVQKPRVAILETPAGFELNSAHVAGRIGEFLQARLQNYRPLVTVVPARRRGTPFSPDDPALARSVLDAEVVFLGPGSPTYAVRQLSDSVVWHCAVARHRLGAALVLASAAAIAVSQYVLPVYEIYKAGLDPHWQTGLNFFAPFGLRLVFIPHWNNRDGGAELDTSRCFMGQERFDLLRAALPAEVTVVGIDEHTALVMDLTAGKGRVIGKGGVAIQRGEAQETIMNGRVFSLSQLGQLRIPDPQAGIPPDVWSEALAAQTGQPTGGAEPPAAVQALLAQRQLAREQRDWVQSDALRTQIEASGWQIRDTPTGPQLLPM